MLMNLEREIYAQLDIKNYRLARKDQKGET